MLLRQRRLTLSKPPMYALRGKRACDRNIAYSGRAARGKLVGQLATASRPFRRASLLLRSSSLQVVLRGRPVSPPSAVELVLRRFAEVLSHGILSVVEPGGHFAVAEALLMQC